jgi:thiol-disulfide isomerase/thioredoxin
MKTTRIILIAVLGGAISTGLYFLNQNWIAPAKAPASKCTTAGPMAAEFALTSLEGKQINLKDYRGKVVLLNFWATWCPPCRIEIPGLKNLQKKYGPKGFQVIGMDVISEDDVNDVREFEKQFGLNYPVVLADNDIGKQYGGLIGTPTSILIGCDGRIYGKHLGYAEESVLEQEVRGLLTACRRG